MRSRSLLLLLSFQALSGFASLVGEADDPQIAANGSGNLVAFWEEYSTDHFAVRAANYLISGGWHPSYTLSTGLHDAFDPEAVMNGAGDLLAVWRQNTDGYYAVYAATGTLGEIWGTPTQLSTNDSAFAKVGIDAEGQGVALWQEKDGMATFHIATSSFTPGSGWSIATPLSESSKVLMTPAAASDSNGRTVAAWQMPSVSSPLYKLAIQAAFYSAISGWSAPLTLSDILHDSVSPRVGVSATGEALVVWQTNSVTSELGQVFVATLSAAGDWGAPVALSESSADASFPNMAMNAAGQAVVVWQSKESGSMACKAIYRSADGVWGTVTEIAPSGVLLPEVAINSSGKSVAIWAKQTGEAEVLIQAAVYSGASWSSPTTVSGTGLLASDPEVRVNNDGSASLVWQSQSAGTISILSSTLSTDNIWSAPGVIN